MEGGGARRERRKGEVERRNEVRGREERRGRGMKGNE